MSKHQIEAKINVEVDVKESDIQINIEELQTNLKQHVEMKLLNNIFENLMDKVERACLEDKELAPKLADMQDEIQVELIRLFKERFLKDD